MASLTILQAAPQMQFQDLGRFGYAEHGISQGGAVDLHAHYWANWLLGNLASSTTLEIPLGNTSFIANEDMHLALTGAEMHATIDDSSLDNWSSFTLKEGQQLSLKFASSGLRSYLACSGGWDAPKILGSTATVIRNSISSFLSNNTQICALKNSLLAHQRVPRKFIRSYNKHLSVRFIPHPDSSLTNQLSATPFTISPATDRMGIRLEGDPILSEVSGIISEGVSLGCIQLPPDGKPIILLNDRQTQGGYLKLGHIAKVDLPLLAQAPPHTHISFQPISLEEARTEWQKFCLFFKV